MYGTDGCESVTVVICKLHVMVVACKFVYAGCTQAQVSFNATLRPQNMLRNQSFVM
jgi:hypothetical protein